MGHALDQERLQFFSRCIEWLKKKLPRDYKTPSIKDNYHWQWIYKPINDKVYFEWKFGRSDFTVNLYFETNDSEENQKLLDMFRPMKKRLEAKLGTKVVFDDEWKRNDTKWARLYAATSERGMNAGLEEWAVEKAMIMIQECEPVLKGDGGRPTQNPSLSSESLYGELPENEILEGAACKATVNRYERDRKAREACLKEFGYSYKCDVCLTNFRKTYGMIGEGFIHVHHRTPLATRKAEYVLNPKKDLVPVCPNCHAMLHYGRPWDSPRSTDELREIWRKQGGN